MCNAKNGNFRRCFNRIYFINNSISMGKDLKNVRVSYFWNDTTTLRKGAQRNAFLEERLRHRTCNFLPCHIQQIRFNGYHRF